MRSRLLKLTIVAIVGATTLGCGKADYESAMRSKAKALETGSRFLESLQVGPSDILDGAASLQFPIYLADYQTLAMGQKDRVGNPIRRDRIQPPGVSIPGFVECYELFVDIGGRDNLQPVYWYFGSEPGDTKLGAIESRLRNDAAKQLAKSKPAFATVSVDTPSGGAIEFRKLSVKSKQEFSTDPTVPDLEQRDGQFDVYIHSTPSRHVIIALRGSNDAIQNLDAFNKAVLALGTLKVSGGGA